MIFINKKKLNLGHLSTAYHTNFILMDSDDLKNDLNMNVNWTLFGTGPAMVDAFKNKKLDLGYMGLPPAIIGIDRNISIKCIAGGHVEGTIMIAKKKYKTLLQSNDDMYEVLAQFSGKAIGVPSRGSIHDVIINYYLEKNNLVEEVKIKNYKQAEFIAVDMKKGILEGGVGTPALAVFSKTILDTHLIIPSKYLWADNPSYGIFVHTNIIEEYPEIIIKFISHHKKASYMLRNSPLKAAQKITNSFKIINMNFVKSVLEISPKYCIALSNGYIKSTMKFVKSLHRLGYIKKELNIEDIFNFEFIKKIHPEKNHYSLQEI